MTTATREHRNPEILDRCSREKAIKGLPDPRGLPYVDRLARLTVIRSYVRSHFLRDNADVNWTDIGAKVKQLIGQRISADVREMMQPVSILDQDFDEKVAHLPHAEARASVWNTPSAPRSTSGWSRPPSSMSASPSASPASLSKCAPS